MKVYEIVQYGNFGEQYSYGIFSSEENARLYLSYAGWKDDDDFEIIEHTVDVKLRRCKYEENNKN